MFGESKKSKLAAALEAAKLTGEIESSLSRVEGIMAGRAKIRTAIKATQQAIPGVEEELKATLQTLGDEEAARALEEAARALGESVPVTSPRKAQKAVSAARDNLEGLRARLTGLQVRLTGTEGDLVSAADEFAEARQTFSRRVLDAFREQYVKAAEEFAEVLRLGYGLAQGLGVRLSGLKSIKLVDPENDSKELVPLFKCKRIEGAGWQEQWTENATAQAAFEAVTRVKTVARSLEPDVLEIRKRREQRAAQEAQAKAETRPKTAGLRFSGPDAVIDHTPQERPSHLESGWRSPAEEVQQGREAIERLAEGRS